MLYKLKTQIGFHRTADATVGRRFYKLKTQIGFHRTARNIAVFFRRRDVGNTSPQRLTSRLINFHSLKNIIIHPSAFVIPTFSHLSGRIFSKHNINTNLVFQTQCPKNFMVVAVAFFGVTCHAFLFSLSPSPSISFSLSISYSVVWHGCDILWPSRDTTLCHTLYFHSPKRVFRLIFRWVPMYCILVNAWFMNTFHLFYAYIMPELCIHYVSTVRALCVHYDCTMITRNIHDDYTKHTRWLHETYTMITRNIHETYTMIARCVLDDCSMIARCVLDVASLPIENTYFRLTFVSSVYCRAGVLLYPERLRLCRRAGVLLPPRRYGLMEGNT